MKLSFQPTTEKQRLLIHQWLAMDYVAKYFYGQGLQNTMEDLEKFYQGHALHEHWIAYSEDTPFAYLLTSSVKKPKERICKMGGRTGNNTRPSNWRPRLPWQRNGNSDDQSFSIRKVSSNLRSAHRS